MFQSRNSRGELLQIGICYPFWNSLVKGGRGSSRFPTMSVKRTDLVGWAVISSQSLARQKQLFWHQSLAAQTTPCPPCAIRCGSARKLDPFA